MKISELIEILKNKLETYGDGEINIARDVGGGEFAETEIKSIIHSGEEGVRINTNY